MKKLFTKWPQISKIGIAAGILMPFTLLVSLPVFDEGCTRYQKYALTWQVDAYDISPSARDYPKVPPDQIIVYAGPKFAPKKYELLARLKSSVTGDWLPQDYLIDEFKKKAASLGGNAVVVLKITYYGTDSGVLIETGAQPHNDLGYTSHSLNNGITVVTPLPTKEVNEDTKNLCKGTALVIWTSP